MINGLLNEVLIQAQSGGTFWMPPQASTMAGGVDVVFYYIYWLSVFFFVGIVFCMTLFVVLYRRREGHKEQQTASHSTALEVTWSVIPFILVIIMFYMGFQAYVDMRTPPQNSYRILVIGQKWNWNFQYPNGYIDGDLHAPIETPVELVITSDDVTHSVYIPAFRLKMDAVPGRYNNVWFQATQAGEYPLFCAEYCGTDHSNMISTVFVHEKGDFEVWLEDASNFVDRMPPAEAGERLYKIRGCAQCHSIDGTANDGPTFKNIWGKTEPLRDGSSVVVDENYVRESLMDPNAKIRKGFDAIMPTYQGKLKDKEITAIIEFIKTLKDE
ncbi:MAG: cytochrome c oxidase subunit II [Candidatus Hinthialibacter antarcticus]|nr:cytochrome c oxidase subunit II [Candidatus Hinthialibacter antarcticus]